MGYTEFSAGEVIRAILSPIRITRPPSSVVSSPHPLVHAALILARQVLGGTAKHGKPDAALIVFRQGQLVARVSKGPEDLHSQHEGFDTRTLAEAENELGS
jgi:hypothetical protein